MFLKLELNYQAECFLGFYALDIVSVLLLMSAQNSLKTYIFGSLSFWCLGNCCKDILVVIIFEIDDSVKQSSELVIAKCYNNFFYVGISQRCSFFLFVSSI